MPRKKQQSKVRFVSIRKEELMDVSLDPHDSRGSSTSNNPSDTKWRSPLIWMSDYMQQCGETVTLDQIHEHLLARGCPPEFLGTGLKGQVAWWLLRLTNAFQPAEPVLRTASTQIDILQAASCTRWTLIPGAGHSYCSVILDTLLRAVSVLDTQLHPVPGAPRPDDLQHKFELIIPFLGDPYDPKLSDAELQILQEALVGAHECSFNSDKFPYLKATNAAQAVRSRANKYQTWYQYSPPRGLDRLSASSDRHDLVHTILAVFDTIGQKEGSKLKILLLANGWDAITANNELWPMLRDKFCSLDIHLTVLTPGNKCLAKDPEYHWLGEHLEVWHHYRLNKLVEVLEAKDAAPSPSSNAAGAETLAHTQLLVLLSCAYVARLSQSEGRQPFAGPSNPCDVHDLNRVYGGVGCDGFWIAPRKCAVCSRYCPYTKDHWLNPEPRWKRGPAGLGLDCGHSHVGDLDLDRPQFYYTMSDGKINMNMAVPSRPGHR